MDDVVALPRRKESPGEFLQPRLRPQEHAFNNEGQETSGFTSAEHAPTMTISRHEGKNAMKCLVRTESATPTAYGVLAGTRWFTSTPEAGKLLHTLLLRSEDDKQQGNRKHRTEEQIWVSIC